MNTERVFKQSLYGLVAFASYIMGASEVAWLPYVGIPMAIAGYLWTEHAPPRGAGAGLSNLFGAAALFFAGLEFVSDNPEGKLLAGAHLLAYLTWIVLLQPKTDRLYWALCALAALQVAVSAVLGSGSWFGLCAIAFCWGGIWTLSVFFMYRAEREFRPIAGNAAPEAPMTSTGISRERDSGWINLSFVTGVVAQAAVAMVVSAAFFVLTPRVWLVDQLAFADSRDGAAAGRSVTGFAEEVKLGDLGQTLESVEPVMRVRFLEPDSIEGNVETISPEEFLSRTQQTELLFRGKTLELYDRKRSTWQADPAVAAVNKVPLPRRATTAVQQEFSLEPTTTTTLFSAAPAIAVVKLGGGERVELYYRPATSMLERGAQSRAGSRFHYAVMSTNLLSATQPPVSAVAMAEIEKSGYLERCGAAPAGMQAVPRLARDVIAKVEQRTGRPLTSMERARALEAWLRDSPEFQYSLERTVIDPTLDPVEDFLVNSKRGHCEYFASALVLLLRSAGIPSRMVSGYKGGEVDSATGWVHVQQRHAHVWVEAFVDEPERRSPASKAWLTLDATPAARDDDVSGVPYRLGWWKQVQFALQALWQRYVVNVSFTQQQDEIYKPLGESLKDAWESITNGLPVAVGSMVQLFSSPQELFSWRGGLATFVLLTALAAMIRAAVWLIQRLRALWGEQRRLKAQRRLMVAFYEQFVRLARQKGLQRTAEQTPREFAERVQAELGEQLRPHNAAVVPVLICDAFYRVRFGEQMLAAEDVQTLEAGLMRFRGALFPENA